MEVELLVNGAVAQITLDAPARRNALTPAMARELTDALRSVEEDLSVGVVVLGGGAYFCAGGDRTTLATAGVDPAGDQPFRDMDAIYQTFIHLGELSVPSIAAIRGGAVGAGVNLALAADVRVISTSAVLMSGFIGIGTHPGGGHFGLLDAVTRPEVTTAMTLLGQPISGEHAVELGLAWEAVDDAGVEARAFELASHVRDPELIRFATRSLREQRQGRGVPWPVALRAEQAVQMWSLRRRVSGT